MALNLRAYNDIAKNEINCMAITSGLTADRVF